MRDIPGYEGRYSVSRDGVVFSIFRNRARTLSLRSGGYYTIQLSGETLVTHSVHVLVALTYIGPRPEGMVINHKDGNRLNNDVDNLEYVTTRENIAHARSLKRSLPTGVQKSGKRYQAKIGFKKEYVYLGLFDTPEEASAAYVSALHAAGQTSRYLGKNINIEKVTK